MKRLTCIAALAAAAVLSTGCSRHHHGRSLTNEDFPHPHWPSAQIFVDEGSTVDVTLTIDKDMPAPTVITLSSADTSRVTLPASVTFPAHVLSKTVTLTTMPDADLVESIVLVTATGPNSSDEMGVRLQETSSPLGAALGPVTVGANRAVLVTAGADGIWSTPDDELVIASGVGTGVPVLTHVTIGPVTPGPHALPVVTGVSDSVLVMTNGPDLLLGTSDDTLVQVGGVSGGSPSVTSSVVVGRMEASEGRRPVMVGTTAVFLTRGADLLTNGDDKLAMIGGIGTAVLSMTTIGTPGVTFEAPSIAVMVDSSSVVLHLTGADLVAGTPDDTVAIVTAIGTAPVLTTLGTAALFPGRMGAPVRISASTVAFIDEGPDSLPGTADDRVVVVRNILAVPVAVTVTVGAVMTDLDSRAVSTGSDSILVPLEGADLLNFTADDQVGLVVSLSAGVLAPPTLLPAGNPVAGAHGQIVMLSSSSAARITAGADGILGTVDDGLALFTTLTGVAVSANFPTGALQPALPLVVSTSKVVVVGEGADATPGTADDVVREVSGIGTSPVATTVYTGSFRLAGPPALVPVGAANALLARTDGADNAPDTADDMLLTAPVP